MPRCVLRAAWRGCCSDATAAEVSPAPPDERVPVASWPDISQAEGPAWSLAPRIRPAESKAARWRVSAMRVTTSEVPLAITAPAMHPAAKLRPGSILETSWPRTVSALAHVGVAHAAKPARPAQMAGFVCLLVMTKRLPRGGDGVRRLSTGLRRRAHQTSGGQSGNGLVCLVCVYRRSNNYSSWCIGTSWRKGCFYSTWAPVE